MRPILACVLLSACGGSGQALDPLAWWHNLEGGKIAEARPPPPKADAPYPGLETVPARPPVTDPAARAKIARALIADRTNATYAASLAPLPPPPSGPPPAPPPAQPSQMSATMPGADAPPAPPRPAPVTRVTARPLAAPVAAPELPATPPPPPVVLDAGLPAVTAPAPPPVAPTPPPPATPIVAGEPLAVPFVAGSAVLEPPAQESLRKLAKARGKAGLAVIGYGEALSSAPADQSAALPLAWQRAQAIASVLQAAGVSTAELKIAAEAEGRGGVARIAE